MPPSVCALRRIHLPCKGLRSRAPPAADTARRSRCSGRRAQACFSARRAMRAPQTGRWMRRKAQTEGCIAALRRRYPAKLARNLPHIRRGRCLHRPGNLAMPQCPRRRAKSPALHCGRDRAAADERPLSVKHAGGPMRSSAPTQRGRSTTVIHPLCLLSPVMPPVYLAL